MASSSLDSWRLRLFRVFSALCSSCSVVGSLRVESPWALGEIVPDEGGVSVPSGLIMIRGVVLRAVSTLLPVFCGGAGVFFAGVWVLPFLGLALSGFSAV